jgi:hypothetical protein
VSKLFAKVARMAGKSNLILKSPNMKTDKSKPNAKKSFHLEA